jgi:hypothetical protein
MIETISLKVYYNENSPYNLIKRNIRLLSVFWMLFFVVDGFAQVANYSYVATTSTWVSNVSPTSIHGATEDDALSSAINIGFNFTYNGVSYSQFKASTNGFITFNTANTSPQPVNNLNTSIERVILAVLWDDNRVASTSGNVNYKLTGSSPNRVLTIEWYKLRWLSTNNSSGSISCQIKLYETTNFIEYIYDRTVTGATFSLTYNPTSSIGLGGQNSGDFLSLSDILAFPYPTSSNTIENASIGTSPFGLKSSSNNNNTSNNMSSGNLTTRIGSGTKYIFKPPIITLASNTVNATDKCASSTKVSLQSFSLAVTNGMGNLTNISFTTSGTYTQSDVTKYQLWYGSTNSINSATQLGTDLSSSGGAASRSFSTFSSPILSSNTTYYFWITADISSSPSNNATIAVNAITTSDLTSTNIKAGSTSNGGIQTLKVGPIAIAGSNLSAICQGGTSAEMGGSVGGSATGGTWSGGLGSWANATNPSIATYTASASESGTIALTLTTTGGSCGITSITKNININIPPNAGIDIIQCNTDTFTMAASGTGKGAWTVVSGTAFITNNSSSTTTVTGVPLGTSATLKWTILGSVCSPENDTITISNFSDGTWTGVTSTNWNTASNWTFGVPTSGTNVVIPSGTLNSPNINSAAAVANSVTINSGATLTMDNANTITLTSGGSFVNNGSFTAGNGTVIFDGSGTISGSGSLTFNNLTVVSGTLSFIPNPSVASIAGNFIILDGTVTPPSLFKFNGDNSQSIAGLSYNNIEFSGNGNKTFTSDGSVSSISEIIFGSGSGTIDFDGNGTSNFTLKSDASGTAQLSNIGNFSLIGNVIVERYLLNDQNKRLWRLLTVPVKGTSNNKIFETWQNNGLINGATGTDVWGPGSSYSPESNGMYYLPVSTHNFRKYNNGAWSSVTNTRTEELFGSEKNNTFLTFIVKPAGSGVTGNGGTGVTGSSPTTLIAKGSLLSGTQNYTIANTNYHLIGNPYASPIDFENLITTAGPNGNTVTEKIWILDPKLGDFGNYVTWDPEAGYSNVNSANHITGTKIIQSGQGFFVKGKSAATSTNFEIKESDKIASNSYIFGRTASINNERIRVNLDKITNNISTHKDACVAVFYNEASNAVTEKDVQKFSNPAETLSFYNGTTSLSSEHRSPLVDNDVLFIRLTQAVVNSTYKIKINTENFNFSGSAIFHDLKLGTTITIPLDGSVFEYSFNVTNDATTQGTRFKIVFTTSVLGIEDNINALGVTAYPNPTTSTIGVILNTGNLIDGSYAYKIINILGQEIQNGIFEKMLQNQEVKVRFNQNMFSGWYSISILNKNKIVATIPIIVK